MIQSFGWEGCEALSAVGILFKLLHVVVVALGVIIGVVVDVSVVAVVVVCGWYGCCCLGTFKSWLWLWALGCPKMSATTCNYMTNRAPKCILHEHFFFTNASAGFNMPP